MSSSVRIAVKDTSGITFDPASLPHAFTYDSNGNLLQDQCIEQGAIVRVKTFTYTEINSAWMVATESAWINVTENWQG